jgi:WD40 repeat protein
MMRLRTESVEVTVWDLATGKVLHSLPVRFGRPCVVSGVTFTPEGTRLATLVTPRSASGRTAGGEVRVWDTTSGAEVLCVKGLPDGAGALAFSPDGKSVAAGGTSPQEREASVKVLDAATGGERLALTGHAGWLRGLAFSPDGARLASAGGDGLVRLWEVAGKGAPGGVPPARILRGHTVTLRDVAFSADGRLISAAGEDGLVKVWETTPCEERVRMKVSGGWLAGTARRRRGGAVRRRLVAARRGGV